MRTSGSCCPWMRLGIYTDEPGSQKLPFPFSLIYPTRGNFLSFIGDFRSRKHMGDVTRGFKKGSSFPIEAGVVPKWVKGAAWSDHVSFWKFGYPGIMVTDTGGFRSASHTTKEDTLEKLNFEAMSRIVMGMYCSIVELTRTRDRHAIEENLRQTGTEVLSPGMSPGSRRSSLPRD